MALAEAILVCLTDRPMSGYDLAKAFDASIGFFWRASHQQIYRELGNLRNKGLVESHEITQQGKPNRIVHTITPAGKKALKNWSAKPTRRPSLKDELLVKLYALEHMDFGALTEQFELRLDQHLERAATFERIRARHFAGKDLSVTERGKLIALELGIADETRSAQWCEETIEKLKTLRAKDLGPKD